MVPGGFWRKGGHPLDPRARQIAFDLGQLHVEEAAAILRDDADAREAATAAWRAALDTLERLARKYPNTDEASHAFYAMGRLYDDELQELRERMRADNRCVFVIRYRNIRWIC